MWGMPGLRVGIVGTGGVGIAAADALIFQGLTGCLTLYDRSGDRAMGEALDYLHAMPLLPATEIRGRSLDDIEAEDVLVIAVGAHTAAGQSRLDVLRGNLDVMAATAEAIERGGLPRVAIVVSSPLDVLTEYLNRRWAGRPVRVMGSGTSLDTLRFNELLARQCGVHPRSVHAWVVGEHGDSSVFLFSGARIGAMSLADFAGQRDVDITPDWQAGIEQDVRHAAYRVRELTGASRHGIGLAVSGLIRCIGREAGTIIPVSVRVADDVCASLPCALGPDGPSLPLIPAMNAAEHAAWERSLEVLRKANTALPF
jgi:L-lactate dehydrogenase